MKKGVWIDENLFEIDDFDLNDIIIYSIVKGFNTNKKVCYVTNGYFAKRIKKSNDTVRKSIKKMAKKGYLKSTENFYYKSNRVLEVTNKIHTAPVKLVEGLLKNDIPPIGKTSNNNTSNNKENIYISPYLFLKKNNSIEIDIWEKENKKEIPDYKKFIEYFDLKVQEDKIDLDVNKLFSRLKRLKFNWNPRETNNKSFNDLPIKQMKRIG